jgi:hypothetical protein
VDRQSEEAVKLLLAAGALPHALVPAAPAPLALACELGNPAIVTALLKAGADARYARPAGASARALCAAAATPVALAAMQAKLDDMGAQLSKVEKKASSFSADFDSDELDEWKKKVEKDLKALKAKKAGA